jgi:L-glyceraldehyde 3-phosphate reductase
MIRGSAAERRDAVACALDHGVNYFDTAPGYGDSISESNLGRTLRELGARPIVATKVALDYTHLVDIDGAVERSIHASLRRLQLNELPIVQLHNRVGAQRAERAPFGTGALMAVEDILGAGGVIEAFERQRERGLVRYFGCTAFGGEMSLAERLLDSAAFDVITVHYSLWNTSAWMPGVPARAGLYMQNYNGVGARAAERDVGVIALRVLEGGAMTADGLIEAVLAAGLHQPADPVSPPEAAIRFALSNPGISTVLIGFSERIQVEQAAGYSSRGPLPGVCPPSIGSGPMSIQ